MEARQPLPPAHARRALKALVQADTFERFLAANFPASKVRRYAPLSRLQGAALRPSAEVYMLCTLRETQMAWARGRSWFQGG